MKKIGVVAVLLAGVAGVAMMTRDSSGRASAAEKLPAGPAEVVAPATVEATGDRVDLAFEQPGRVVAVLVEEGEQVHEGQLLARLDDRIPRARVARAEAALASAQARHEMALHGARPDEIRAARAEAEAARATARERVASGARAEKLPTLLEIRTYRFMGHSMSDPGNYRTREEIAKYQERDPIVLFKDSLKESGVLTEKDFETIEKEAVEATERALKFADESPLPNESELLTDVYA